jgi:glucose-1-phosphate thymidylyltransferase
MELRTAVVLCAGLGSRLWPVTLRKPKVLIEVAGRSILDRILDDLVACGITRAVFVISPFDQFLRSYLAEQGPAGVQIAFAVQNNPRGLGHATATARDAVGDEPFLLHLGDELLEGIADFVARARDSSAAAVVLLKEVGDPERFGVAVLQGERIVKLVEKPQEPQEPPSSLAVVGVYVFDPAIFRAIEETPESGRGEIEITDAIQRLADQGREVLGVVYDRTWYDVGTHDALLESNRFLMDREVTEPPPPVGERCNLIGPSRVALDVQAADCRILGPAIIGRGCRLRNAQIGPYVCLGDNTVVEDSAVEDSIIADRCHLRGVARLYHSVLDSEVAIRGDGTTEVSLTAGQRSSLRFGPPEGR